MTDSSQSFLQAWGSACSSSQPVTIHVPAGNFLITGTTFSGPCKNTDIEFLIDGTIVAPPKNENLRDPNQWIMFDTVEGVSINGGTFDGRGEALWNCKSANNHHCPDGAPTLIFSNSKNMAINSITSINSELFHVVILGCNGVTLQGVSIIAPESSPNTDGIHVESSTGVTIIQANIKTGDDCISIGPGTSHLWIERVNCGPGHGISIGSLGKKGQGLDVDGVQNVTVKTTVFTGAKNGFRIKTWGTKSRGYVKNVAFVDAMMRNVENPIIIDQHYCPDDDGCPSKGSSSGIKISDVKYKQIHGTSASQVAVNLDCSSSNPCSQISMQDIKLMHANGRSEALCKNAQGASLGNMVPPSCL
ncbi:polygalacturonase-like protein [Carex littledalei]|uniref:Exopolygalacturonase n=1 Tax=Carex littledalei TaxID=544730 RepID=A0A833VNL4_9POAL|nr:polygalacturonase-like protein [Carex littledalei]